MPLWLLPVIAALVGIAYYAVSLRVRPWAPCRRCKGRGRRGDVVFPWASGACPKCGNQGRLPRLGVRVFTPERAKAMMPARGSHLKADRRGE